MRLAEELREERPDLLVELRLLLARRGAGLVEQRSGLRRELPERHRDLLRLLALRGRRVGERLGEPATAGREVGAPAARERRGGGRARRTELREDVGAAEVVGRVRGEAPERDEAGAASRAHDVAGE